MWWKTVFLWLGLSALLCLGAWLAWHRGYFDGDKALLAEVMLVAVLWIEGLFAWLHLRQDHGAARTSSNLLLALEVNRQIQDFRNDKEVRLLRRQIEEFGRTPDCDQRLIEMWEGPSGDNLRWYLARMNSLCWVIEQCPPDAWAGVTDTIDKNLVREWTCVKGLAKRRRAEKGDDPEQGWYLHNFQAVAERLAQRSPRVSLSST
ncbi:MAG: hypothetical protein HY369_01625 [Candidatus Aenigmarchaeota archaeon]|nr:hypothetical protein [Candidatus Aenigmarchaeota archaeon]